MTTQWAGARRTLFVLFALYTAGPVARAQVGSAPQPSPAPIAPSPSPNPTLSNPMLDLTNPKVLDRLRAAGIDPDELQKLMQSKGIPPTSAGATAASVAQSSGAFPPVTSPPSQTPVLPDTTHLRTAQADTTKPEEHFFGYEFFKLTPSTFEPLAFGPVGADYLVGPGDEIIVSVWGAQELNTKVTVNREGYILLPDLGQFMVNGFTVKGLKEHLEKQLSRIYSGIRSDGRGRTSVDVSLGKLRSIQVFVLGDVTQPGGYTVSATSTVMNALYYAGGPTIKGSMRNVRVLRNNAVIGKVDLYAYIAAGEKGQDRQLQNGDVVFVPPVSRRVTLQGEVKRPAIYEMRDEEKLRDLLAVSGGLKSTAYLRRIQIERIIPFEQRSPLSQEDRKVIDLDLRTPSAPGAGVDLYDSDIVRVFRVGEILKNTVRLLGSPVYKPGTYEHREGMTVADLVEQAGGLQGDAYTGWAHLVRTRRDKTRELMSFNLATALRRDPKTNIMLEEMDEVQVFSVWDIRDDEFVSINGLVRHPGKYSLLQGMSVTDLIVKAGGMRESAYRMRAEVSRIDPAAVSDGKTAELVYVSMSDSLTFDSEASRFKLMKNDIVFIREIPNWGLQENVWLTGEVKFPGMYSLTSKTDKLSQLIDRAGGLEPTAYLQAATFIRKKDNTGRMALDFQQALARKGRHNSKFDMVLAAGDSIHIPREPKTVKVAGAVGFPSSVLWEEGRDMGYYIEQAGGTLEDADKDKITLVMASGRVKRPRFLRSPEPDAGSNIVVPHKPEEKQRETLKNFAAIVSILSGAATTIYLISRSAH